MLCAVTSGGVDLLCGRRLGALLFQLQDGEAAQNADRKPCSPISSHHPSHADVKRVLSLLRISNTRGEGERMRNKCYVVMCVFLNTHRFMKKM